MSKRAKLIPIKDFPRKLRDPVKALEYLKNDPPESWERRGQQMALKLFHSMATRVPAYKDFLKKNKIRHTSIKTIKDFAQIPTVDKDNYLRKYGLDELSWDGELHQQKQTIATTSGSTGTPFYFPHNKLQDWHYALIAELYLLTNFSIDKRSTLYINAFPMGAWIGGVFTYEAIQLVSDRGDYDISIINPGLHKAEVAKAITTLGNYYDQIIIGGYGPFVKDILDEGKRHGINWRNYDIKFIFSAESFSEEFRSYIAKKVGLANECIGTLNHYGTVDLGTMAYETPLAIAVRKEALSNNKLRQTLFHDRSQLPTFTQYIPEIFYFETVNEALLCTANSGLPLIRYDLKDVGGTATYRTVEYALRDAESDLSKLSDKFCLGESVWTLPFVYVYERSDFSVSYHAFQVYPDTIRRALLDVAIAADVSGKFVMQVINNKKMDQILEVKVELQHERKPSALLRKKVGAIIKERLLSEISEYRETHIEKGEKVNPLITLCMNGGSSEFLPGVKQRWVKKHDK